MAEAGVQDCVLESLAAGYQPPKGRRSVSAQAHGYFNKFKEGKLESFPKSAQQRERIRNSLFRSSLFSEMDSAELQEQILDSVFAKTYNAGQSVIRQNEIGHQLFVVKSGLLKCSKEVDGKQTYLRDYVKGQLFGELAMLYNCGRQASIIAETECELWVLKREVLNNLNRNSAIGRRDKFKAILERVQLLKSMNEYDRLTLAENLSKANFKAGEFVVNRGDLGNQFYLVDEGELEAVKDGETVMRYKPGDYFGEIALLKDVPRQASVRCASDCKLLVIDRETFVRMLGPVEEVLKQHLASYEGLTL